MVIFYSNFNKYSIGILIMKTYFKEQIVRLKGKKLQELKQKVIERDEYTCKNPKCSMKDLLCYPPSSLLFEYTKKDAHHILPLGQGGSDIEENLITLCRHCHKKVHDKGTLKIYLRNGKIIYE